MVKKNNPLRKRPDYAAKSPDEWVMKLIRLPEDILEYAPAGKNEVVTKWAIEMASLGLAHYEPEAMSRRVNCIQPDESLVTDQYAIFEEDDFHVDKTQPTTLLYLPKALNDRVKNLLANENEWRKAVGKRVNVPGASEAMYLALMRRGIRIE